ncbi:MULTISPECIES: toprim domain-containing protein [Weeksellaceae]|uniref:toprim domain-containing protein n=1 Tax=Weeksellaceae TaxID=2762318 RepID=UPI0011853AEF|nr:MULTISPECIES: toprim domain-containing protein [Weeksellaceae]MCT3630144.1 toprim domain-containing protein [Elizabethkingia anophelis]MCT3633658.1 toprim domain-containing protein [Elizabethkingia anophelis]MCT3830409.1 toprim domain-containing protein [Elizabethkingia anophelis]MCT3883862.1 toprim domain-containing protein [Elizabethkingia anophelis]MCT3894630.1 toprim domain-containing protein [Elizabethkingia anophelis]
MNCRQFNTIPLEEVLQILGHLPTKQNEKEAWYCNPFSTENQASFKLDKRNNIWYLHSEGIGGNNTDFMQKYLKASVKVVLEWAENQIFSSFQLQNSIQKQNSLKQNYQITEIKELQNENLKDYLQQRGLSTKVYPLVKEIHFRIDQKNLYAIGFENLSGGWELRNSFYKGSLLKKDISILNFNNESHSQNETGKRIVVFEGFMDALSFVEMKPFYKGDVLVMNSISLLNRTKEYLKNYSEIHLFLDNDKAGETCKNSILKSFPEAKDHSEIYALHKDLNDYLKSKKENKNSIEISNSILKTEEEEIKQPHQIYQRKR